MMASLRTYSWKSMSHLGKPTHFSINLNPGSYLSSAANQHQNWIQRQNLSGVNSHSRRRIWKLQYRAFMEWLTPDSQSINNYLFSYPGSSISSLVVRYGLLTVGFRAFQTKPNHTWPCHLTYGPTRPTWTTYLTWSPYLPIRTFRIWTPSGSNILPSGSVGLPDQEDPRTDRDIPGQT